MDDALTDGEIRQRIALDQTFLVLANVLLHRDIPLSAEHGILVWQQLPSFGDRRYGFLRQRVASISDFHVFQVDDAVRTSENAPLTYNDST